MTILIIGLVLFLGIHFLPCIVALRTALFNKLGEKGYKIVFSLVAFVGLVLIVVGKIQAEFVSLWIPPSWGRTIAIPLVFVAFVLLPAAHMKTNIKRFTRHPMLWGVACWAVAHLLANGDKASVILFASFGVYALVDMMSANFRGAQLQTQSYPLKNDVIVVAAGAVVYTAILFLHPYLFGVAVV